MSTPFDSGDLAAQQVVRELQELQESDLDTLRLLLTEARTHNGWQERDVSMETLQALYNLMKYGPTSANACPARLVFLRSSESKERVRPALKPNNVDKTMSAPVTVIIGYDLSLIHI